MSDEAVLAEGATPFCCAAFAAEATRGPDVGLEQAEDGTWAVNGCCHGGCYVVKALRFCPWCGTRLVGA